VVVPMTPLPRTMTFMQTSLESLVRRELDRLNMKFTDWKAANFLEFVM
jgi:hypothetical protein